LGIYEHPPTIDVEKTKETWNDYISLSNPPQTLPENNNNLSITSIYRGIVPAKNIAKRDFAIIGAMVINTLYRFPHADTVLIVFS